MDILEKNWPIVGWGETKAQNFFEVAITERSAALGSHVFFAHMDPPTPSIASHLVGLNAEHNQNLLHPDLSPFASLVEHRLMEWLAPMYGMSDGHMCSGSTIGNLTGLWAAREAGATHVIGSCDAHLSIPKAAHLLGLPYQSVPTLPNGQMNSSALPNDLSNAALVLTAGTTGRGAIDPLDEKYNALWIHIDAAWAAPLMLTTHNNLLVGIDRADSLVISAHKWFYQAKDSALVLFKSSKTRDNISFSGDYLVTPNIGIQGSRSAAAIPLMATLLAWGQSGLASRIENDMQNAARLAAYIDADSTMSLKQQPTSGVLNWQPTHQDIEKVILELRDVASHTVIDNEVWLRQVAANPNVDIDKVCERITQACLPPSYHG